MFKTSYFSHLINKLRNYRRHAPSSQSTHTQWEFTTSQRRERASVACILARARANDNQSARSKELLNFALAYRIKELIEKLLHKKYCSWLDLLNSNQTPLQEPLASLLQPLHIYKIKDLARLRNVPNSQLIDLLNKLNRALHKYEHGRTTKLTIKENHHD